MHCQPTPVESIASSAEGRHTESQVSAKHETDDPFVSAISLQAVPMNVAAAPTTAVPKRNRKIIFARISRQPAQYKRRGIAVTNREELFASWTSSFLRMMLLCLLDQRGCGLELSFDRSDCRGRGASCAVLAVSILSASITILQSLLCVEGGHDRPVFSRATARNPFDYVGQHWRPM